MTDTPNITQSSGVLRMLSQLNCADWHGLHELIKNLETPHAALSSVDSSTGTGKH